MTCGGQRLYPLRKSQHGRGRSVCAHVPLRRAPSRGPSSPSGSRRLEEQAGGRVSVGRRAAGTIQPRATRARAPPPRRVEAGGSSAATGSREAGGAGQTAPRTGLGGARRHSVCRVGRGVSLTHDVIRRVREAVPARLRAHLREAPGRDLARQGTSGAGDARQHHGLQKRQGGQVLSAESISVCTQFEKNYLLARSRPRSRDHMCTKESVAIIVDDDAAGARAEALRGGAPAILRAHMSFHSNGCGCCGGSSCYCARRELLPSERRRFHIKEQMNIAPGRGRTLPSKVKSLKPKLHTCCVLGDWLAVWMRHTPLPLP